jgi:Flp pilus assembly secretin CpaC
MGQKMTARTNGNRKRRAVLAFGQAAIAIAAAGFLSAQAEASGFLVEINQSKALRLSSAASAVVVGNPSIAEVSVLGPKLIYVLGRSYGRTNVIALDVDGKQIADLDVNVVSPTSSTVTLTRGSGQLTYNCAPRCERTVAQGDDGDAFDRSVKQSGDASALASGTATSADQQAGGLSLSIGGGGKSSAR